MLSDYDTTCRSEINFKKSKKERNMFFATNARISFLSALIGTINRNLKPGVHSISDIHACKSFYSIMSKKDTYFKNSL